MLQRRRIAVVVSLLALCSFIKPVAAEENNYSVLIASLTTIGIILIAFVYERLPDNKGIRVFKAITSESGIVCIIAILLGKFFFYFIESDSNV